VRRGDTVGVTSIDCLARSLKDLQDTVDELKSRGVRVRATRQSADTGTVAGKALPASLSLTRNRGGY
jgi:DNA invertase Pin-like site-specific DNA recombinase